METKSASQQDASCGSPKSFNVASPQTMIRDHITSKRSFLQSNLHTHTHHANTNITGAGTSDRHSKFIPPLTLSAGPSRHLLRPPPIKTLLWRKPPPTNLTVPIKDPPPLHRSPLGHRPRRRLRPRGALHERHARDASMRLQPNNNPDPRHAGRRSVEVHGVQCA